jgi:hypothetical protein
MNLKQVELRVLLAGDFCFADDFAASCFFFFWSSKLFSHSNNLEGILHMLDGL